MKGMFERSLMDPKAEQDRREAEAERFRDGPVMRYINQGYTMEQAADHFELPTHVIKRIVQLVNGKRSHRDKPSRIRARDLAAERGQADREMREARDKEILRLRDTDLSATEIGIRVGLSRNRVKAICKEAGVPFPIHVPQARPRLHTQVKPGEAVIIDSDDLNDRRARISSLMAADRHNRPTPKITLPRVSILEGVMD